MNTVLAFLAGALVLAVGYMWLRSAGSVCDALLEEPPASGCDGGCWCADVDVAAADFRMWEVQLTVDDLMAVAECTGVAVRP